MAKQLPAGCAGLDYGSPPHVGDAIVLLKEAWDKISPPTIAGCWVHSRCLPLNESTELAATERNYYQKLDADSVQAMCNTFCSLSLAAPNVNDMLGNLGLNIVANAAAKKVNDTAVQMLTQWLHLEDEGTIDEHDEGEECDNPDVEGVPVDKAQVLNEALPLLERLHSVGAKLNDAYFKDAVRQMCSYVKDCTSGLN